MAITIPLRILLTDPALAEHEDIKDQLESMRKQGHEIVVDATMSGWDFIAGPNCWLLRPEVAGLFDMAVKNSRRIANADQERVQQVTATKAAQRKPRTTGKASTRSRKVKGVVGETNNEPVINITNPSLFGDIT